MPDWSKHPNPHVLPRRADEATLWGRLYNRVIFARHNYYLGEALIVAYIGFILAIVHTIEMVATAHKEDQLLQLPPAAPIHQSPSFLIGRLVHATRPRDFFPWP